MKAWEVYGKDHDASAKLSDAPERFSATSLVVWAYRQVGILLADDLLTLHRCGEEIVGSDLASGDLVFRTGRADRFHPEDASFSRGVGHVGLYAGENVILHASYWGGLVSANPIDWFLDIENGRFRGVRRILAR